jgi:hypothetical protein
MNQTLSSIKWSSGFRGFKIHWFMFMSKNYTNFDHNFSLQFCGFKTEKIRFGKETLSYAWRQSGAGHPKKRRLARKTRKICNILIHNPITVFHQYIQIQKQMTVLCPLPWPRNLLGSACIRKELSPLNVNKRSDAKNHKHDITFQFILYFHPLLSV